MTTNEKIALVREVMQAENITAYIIPSSDPHQSEYVADHWKFRTWISGFTGSMGYVVITQNHAGVWTDGRYFMQCENEIAGTEFKMYKQLQQGAPEHIDWICSTISDVGFRMPGQEITTELPQPKSEIRNPKSVVGCDGKLFSPAQIRVMQRAFKKYDIELVTHIDMANRVWENRPPMPADKIFEHPTEFNGKSSKEKIADIRKKMSESVVSTAGIRNSKSIFHLVTTLDDIAWTLNLRGSDVESNPVFYAYMVVGEEKTWLFVDFNKLSDLKNAQKGISALHSPLSQLIIKPYEDIHAFLKKLTRNNTVIVDAANVNFSLMSEIKKATVIERETFSIRMKAVKNETEIKHIRNVMAKDGAALVKAFMWLEQTLEVRTVREYEFASMLAQFRSDQPHYFGESFSAIVGYKSNGAMMHYRPDVNDSAEIKKEGILLVDSGGQYADGTTDITRTIALGKPTDAQKKHFTLVLKGHIALARAIFPTDTKGIQLDILARQFLWQYNLNYGHGTGHGVGFFMNVHEPPQGFVSVLNARGTTPQEPGMLTSNEPGFYLEGQYGIRIENLVLCVEKAKSDFGSFLCFETVTLFPMDKKLIDIALLTPEETDWLNDYHAIVFGKLSPLLDEKEKKWILSQWDFISNF